MRLSRFRLFVAATVPLAVAATVGVVSMTAASAAAGCQITYSVGSQWPGGFTGNVTVTNLGDPLSSWTLTWSFASGQQVTQAWSSTVSQSGAQVTARNVSWNGNLATNGSTSFGFNGSWNNSSNPAPTNFTLNGTACNGTTQPTTGPTTGPNPTPTTPRPTTPPPTTPPATGGPNTMGFIGCSMAENVSQGYRAVGGQRMWGPYGTGGAVVQSWTNTNSASWQSFDRQAAQYGRPATVWIQICIFAQNGVTYNEVRQLITNARQHAAPGANIIISGQPLYDAGQTCFLAGSGGPELTDSMARQAAADASQNVTYPGVFRLRSGEVSDGCHANTAGQQSLGHQAMGYWG
ncbi:cellulose-binding domain-containing protein [Plantactinospora sp. KLBMP9567]|uniref:cellulose-binding domain-containing protein n=1 Tax=Plantactinospora sp. KLBMP9567 TaxID=3085900 RepID=UPI002981CD8D|nr:cellulose-binding domain-containing protein [Plantactinospora sp. KLBMP9567]MDW5330291.1 cellulose-binding domain-containing protein [Plantactinospora sp. KLBMP9567]